MVVCTMCLHNMCTIVPKNLMAKGLNTCLANCTWPISHNITPLAINALGGRHTNTHTHTQMQEPKQFQETRHVWPLAACAWFNEIYVVKIFLKSKHPYFITLLYVNRN